MGLTNQSTGINVLSKGDRPAAFIVNHILGDEPIIALAGNPNVGKSTVFNSLTGLNQHTGNWPGKTVTNAQGRYRHKDKSFILVDLPGTYSLMSNSAEEEIARDFICFGKPNATVVITDATCLERNLNLVLQTLEITNDVVVCVNLMDDAKRKKIHIDIEELSNRLGVPVVGTSARSNMGLKELMDNVYQVAGKRRKTQPLTIEYDHVIEKAIQIIEPDIKKMVGDQINSRWIALKLLDGEKTILDSLNRFLGFNLMADGNLASRVTEAMAFLKENNIDSDRFRDLAVSNLIRLAEDICHEVVAFENQKYNDMDRKIDNIVTSKLFGFPIMIGLLGLIFWLTITGANYPSDLIATFLFRVEEHLTGLFRWAGAPEWFHGIFVLGIYRTLAWVVAVMLPPMAIFFPLFTLLEDLGYLPRVAFNLDNFFKKACAHGKQALTMCMGFGCNAAGVIGCRIIDSPRERLIATITNNFAPCNGRFPTLIAISAIFIGGATGAYQSLVSALTMMGVVVLGIVMTLLISRILSNTILKGLPSSFTLELPPYRKPQIGRILIRSIFDRTLFVLARAVMVAAPAGLIIWILANIHIGEMTLLTYCANFLQPFAHLIGLDGYILMAFILGFPANEIVVPIIIMGYMAEGNILDLDSLKALKELLVSHGWTWLTAICVMLFSVMHFPCGTTLWTIRKETQSAKWTLVSFLVPTITGIIVCFVLTQIVRLLGLI
jgi:ferrous iron transport protein B